MVLIWQEPPYKPGLPPWNIFYDDLVKRYKPKELSTKTLDTIPALPTGRVDSDRTSKTLLLATGDVTINTQRHFNGVLVNEGG